LAVLVGAIVVFSVAECLYDAVQGPLISDLAQPDQLGRYVAVTAFSWQFGFIVGPAVGALILAAAPTTLWLVSAGMCVVASAYSLRLDRHLPSRVRRTPGGPASSKVDVAVEPVG
jgi:MFS family permease